MFDYWVECVAEAFEDAKITATEGQIKTVANWIESAHETYGQATGEECIPNPLELEVSNLQRALAKERGKDTCEYCKGVGYTVTYGPAHCSQSTCYECHGEGRL